MQLSLTRERHRGEAPEDVEQVVLHQLAQLLHAASPEQHRLAGDLLRGQLQVIGAVRCLLASVTQRDEEFGALFKSFSSLYIYRVLVMTCSMSEEWSNTRCWWPARAPRPQSCNC